MVFLFASVIKILKNGFYGHCLDPEHFKHIEAFPELGGS